jgi:hypothetical protein
VAGLERELGELERSDPEVGRAARAYRKMRDEVLSGTGRVHRIFEHGGVQVLESDADSRQAAFRMSMPVSVVQTVSPALLGAGMMDQYVLASPLSAWIPSLAADRVKPELSERDPEVARRLNSAVQAKAYEVLELFRTLSQAVVDPSDLIPMLPLGTYVKFRFRCRVDDLPKALSELERSAVAGVGEFRYALASALAEVLLQFHSVSGAASGA